MMSARLSRSCPFKVSALGRAFCGFVAVARSLTVMPILLGEAAVTIREILPPQRAKL